jgi:hypothetical protein
MRILGFLMFLGVIYVVTYVFSQILLVGIGTLLSVIFRLHAYDTGFRIIISTGNFITLYIITSQITITIMKLYEKEQSLGLLIFYAFIGALSVFGITTSGILGKIQNGTYKEEMAWNFNNKSLMLRDDIIKSLISVPFFILALFVPVIVINPATQALFRLTAWTVRIPIIGWILAGIGLLLSFRMIKDGVLACVGLISGSWQVLIKRND